MSGLTKWHILTLDVGDRFRFSEGGPVFRRCLGADPDKVYVEGPEGERKPLVSWIEWEGCFVFPVLEGFEDERGENP